MEQYLLTQEDIDRLNLTDAIAGDVATEQELRALFPAQMNERDQLARQAEISAMELPTPQTAAVQTEEAPMSYMNDYSALRDLGLDVAQTQNVLGAIQADQPAPVTVDQSDTSAFQPAFSQMAPEQLGLTQTPTALLDAIQQPAAPEDPYSALSKTQRRMLAFAAISDAGAALQGMQGRAVRDLMSDFTARADQVRKAKAAQMQQQALQQMMGVGTGQLDLSTPDAIRNHIDQLTMIGMANPSLAPAIGNRIKVLQDEAERLTQQGTQATAQMSGLAAVDALLTSPNLGALTGFTGTINEFFSTIGAAPKYSDLKSYISQLQGLNFLEAYQQLKGGGPITDIEGRQATQARTRLEDAMKSTPENLRVALLEVRKLFQDALDKNPTYTGAGDLTPEELEYLQGN